MKFTQEQIAELFSNGEFEKTFPHLSEDVEWEVIGQFHLYEREAVERKCKETADYFRSVTTDFRQRTKVIGSDNIAISGTAEFTKDGKRLAFVSACDVYEFCGSELCKITSYCLNETYPLK